MTVSTKEIQEWLCLHGIPTEIDGVNGPKTKRSLRMFMESRGINHEWKAATELVRPLTEIRNISEEKLYGRHLSRIPSVARVIAAKHLKATPREVGGSNMGPWVRYYTKGHEGEQWRWCAGFVMTVLEQTYKILNIENPFYYTLSCDDLVRQAKEQSLFIQYMEPYFFTIPKKGWIFMVPNPNSPNDWIHTGIVYRVFDTCFETIEGNATDMIGHESDRVCKRIRSISYCDFIKT